MMTIGQNIQAIQHRLRSYEKAFHRPEHAVHLLAVSKTKGPNDIREAWDSGLRDFGENYVQEALVKIEALKDLPVRWHFIGRLQSNKAAIVAQYFSWMHSLSRLKIALKLNEYRAKSSTPLNVCLQINLTQEASKSGIGAEEAASLASAVNRLPNLRLRGLMTIPPADATAEEAYELYRKLNQLLQYINETESLEMDCLSMGMSHDLGSAIKAGSTIVRVGQAIFGKRELPDSHQTKQPL